MGSWAPVWQSTTEAVRLIDGWMRGEADRIGDGRVPVWPIIRSSRGYTSSGTERAKKTVVLRWADGPKQAKLRISYGSEPTYARLVRVRHHESLCCRFSACVLSVRLSPNTLTNIGGSNNEDPLFFMLPENQHQHSH
jgi:hypothetical protein